MLSRPQSYLSYFSQMTYSISVSSSHIAVPPQFLNPESGVCASGAPGPPQCLRRSCAGPGGRGVWFRLLGPFLLKHLKGGGSFPVSSKQFVVLIGAWVKVLKPQDCLRSLLFHSRTKPASVLLQLFPSSEDRKDTSGRHFRDIGSVVLAV